MENDRPIEDPKLREALNIVQDVFRFYDLAGGIMLVNKDEAAYGYSLYTTWNAIVEDAETPFGFRIRIREEELGKERAEKIALGTAHLFCSMIDFGTQTKVWFGDMLKLLKSTGIRVHHIPFNGRKLPRIGGLK